MGMGHYKERIREAEEASEKIAMQNETLNKQEE